MGLLSRLAGAVPQKKMGDDVLLLHAMLCMAGADGGIDHEEIEMVESFAVSLPEFKNKHVGELCRESDKIVKRYPSEKESVAALQDLSTESLRKKAFVLAADIAMASGDVSQEEDNMLEAMQRVLSIDEAFAGQVLGVLAAKYAV